MHHQSFSVHFKNIHINISSECTASSLNVPERCIALYGRSECSQAATTACRLQLCSVRQISYQGILSLYIRTLYDQLHEGEYCFEVLKCLLCSQKCHYCVNKSLAIGP